jgi:hypothetical protein
MVYDPIGSTYGLEEKTRSAFRRSRAYGSSSRRLVEFDRLQLHEVLIPHRKIDLISASLKPLVISCAQFK